MPWGFSNSTARIPPSNPLKAAPPIFNSPWPAIPTIPRLCSIWPSSNSVTSINPGKRCRITRSISTPGSGPAPRSGNRQVGCALGIAGRDHHYPRTSPHPYQSAAEQSCSQQSGPSGCRQHPASGPRQNPSSREGSASRVQPPQNTGYGFTPPAEQEKPLASNPPPAPVPPPAAPAQVPTRNASRRFFQSEPAR